MNDLGNITAVILVGGLGTRLRPVVFDRPKVLASINKKPFLAHLLNHLNLSGLKKVILCTGYLGDQVKNYFGQSFSGIKLHYSQESSPMGTAGALRLAHSLIDSELVLVLNGDSFCDSNLDDFWLWHQGIKGNASLLLTHVPDTSRYGKVQINKNGRIVKFEEKVSNSGPGLINAGIYLITTRLLSHIPDGIAISLEKDIFPDWMVKGLYGYKSSGRFIDIGTPESYALADNFFSHKK